MTNSYPRAFTLSITREILISISKLHPSLNLPHVQGIDRNHTWISMSLLLCHETRKHQIGRVDLHDRPHYCWRTVPIFCTLPVSRRWQEDETWTIWLLLGRYSAAESEVVYERSIRASTSCSSLPCSSIHSAGYWSSGCEIRQWIKLMRSTLIAQSKTASMEAIFALVLIFSMDRILKSNS